MISVQNKQVDVHNDHCHRHDYDDHNEATNNYPEDANLNETEDEEEEEDCEDDDLEF